MEITGGCPCGAVRYRINGALITTRVCWCRLCQHIGAGSATVNACFPRDAITIEVELGDYRSIALVTAVQELVKWTPSVGPPGSVS